MTITDDFKGDTPHLIECIKALLSLDADGALVPHGIGGHARGLLSAAAVRLAAAPAQPDGEAWYPSEEECSARIGFRGGTFDLRGFEDYIRASIDLYRERIAADRDGDTWIVEWIGAYDGARHAAAFVDHDDAADCVDALAKAAPPMIATVTAIKSAINTATQAQEQGNG